MKKLRICILILGLIFQICSCDNSDKEENVNNPITSKFPEFMSYPENQPVIEGGKKGFPVTISDPVVINDQDGYHLFYTSTFGMKDGKLRNTLDPLGKESEPGYNQRLKHMQEFTSGKLLTTTGYAFSNDRGKTWTFRQSPLVDHGQALWKDSNIETPACKVIDGKLYFFFCAYHNNLRHRYQVGGAIYNLKGASLKNTFLNESNKIQLIDKPILPYNTTATGHDNGIQEPSFIFRNNKIELYYIGLGFSLPDLGFPAETPDGKVQEIVSIGFYKAIFDMNLKLETNTGEKQAPLVNITEIHYHNNKYHLFSTKSPKEDGRFHEKEIIEYYSSTDGKSWSKPKTIMTHNYGTDSYNGWGVMAPTVVFEKDKAVMFYTAFGIEPVKESFRIISERSIIPGKGIYFSLARAEANL